MINNATATTQTGRGVLIVGGGISGLSLARALKDAGHDPLVIERNQEWPATRSGRSGGSPDQPTACIGNRRTHPGGPPSVDDLGRRESFRGDPS